MLVACEDPIEPFDEFEQSRVLVHSVLDTDVDTQKVLIEMTNTFQGGAVVDATVRITTPAGVDIPLQMRNDIRNPNTNTVAVYFFTAATHVLVPGGTYHLRIERPGAEPITGSTTVPTFVPEPPGVNFEAGDELFRPDQDTLRMSWPRIPGARGYEVVFLYSHDQSPEFAGWNSIFADTSISLAGNARTLEGNDLFRRGWFVDLMVLAADDNYHTYYRVGVDPFAGAPPSRLTGGALGVFGSVVPIRYVSFQVACTNEIQICNAGNVP